MIFITIIGPECVLFWIHSHLCFVDCAEHLSICRKHGAHFEKNKTAFEEGAGRDEAILDEDGNEIHQTPQSDSRPTSMNEKERVSTVDRA